MATNPQSISYGVRAAASRLREFTSLYKLVLSVETVFALALLFVPRLVARVFALPHEDGYVLWGAMLLFGVIVQLPGLMTPVHGRLTVVTSVIARGLLTIVYLLLALWIPAAVTLVAAVALWLLFTRLVYAELGARP
jgi:hypothetical protein